jgi:hypothetical protein
VSRVFAGIAPDAPVLTVGLLEREESGAEPDAVERRRYDLVA